MIIEKEIQKYGEVYVKCETFEDFKKWCRSCGWDRPRDFYKETRVSFNNLKGKFFFVCHSRVFVHEEKKLWIEEYKNGV